MESNKIKKPLICHAGSATETSVGSLPLVKNIIYIVSFKQNVNLIRLFPISCPTSLLIPRLFEYQQIIILKIWSKVQIICLFFGVWYKISV